MTGGSQAQRPAPDVKPTCDASWRARETGARHDACTVSDSLFRTVETEIIPRLMLLHHPGGDSIQAIAACNDRSTVKPEQVPEFAALAINDREAAEAYLQNMLRSGVGFESLCLQLLAPAARHLGALWDADMCEFTDVTIALSRLQGLVRLLSMQVRGRPGTAGRGRTALLVPVPGEQHTLGLTMVGDFFRSSGWTVWADAPGSREGLLGLVHEQHFDLVGFSIGNDKHIQNLGELIRAIRTRSRNPDLRVLVGGPLLNERPQIATLVGADATAADARQAMLEAERLVAARDGSR